MISFGEGLQVITDALGEKLGDQVRLKHTAKGVRYESSGWQIDFQEDVAESGTNHSSVLLALPAFRLPELGILCNGKRTDLDLLGNIEHPPVTSVVLGFRREDVAHPLDGFGVLIPELEKFNSLGTIFSSSLFPSRAPRGHVTLTSYIGGTRAPD